MSLTLLLEKYDVSTEEGLHKALSEIEKEESEVDEALAGVLSRACSLEGRMRTASQAYAKLNDVRSDAQVASDMVEKTASLARDVSAKVRQLDLARSRVAECQRRVHDLIDLQLCSAGVEAAIKAHDYETGAAHVARFLSMDEGSVAAARARGAPDPRDAMARAADTLREHLVRKFEDAARKQDEAGVERLLQLFPQIGRADEGVALLANFLATQLEATLRRDCTVPEAGGDGAPFATAFSRLVQAAGATVERARRAAPRRLASALPGIQPTVCAGARRVSRALGARLAGRRAADALSTEPQVAELAQVHATIQLYFTFLLKKTEADAAGLPETETQAAVAATTKLIAECDLTRTAQELLGHYLELERFFLEESVNKALKMATPQPGATTSSLVDDVFYITRKVIRRSISSGSVDGACCVLNEAASLLERAVAGALRRWLRAAPADPLPLAPPPAHSAPSLDPAALLSNRFNRDQDAQNALFLAHLNEAESGAEWSERLAAEAVALCEEAGLARTDAARAKLASCAGGLAGAAAAFRAAHEAALTALHAALKPRLIAWAEFLADPDTDAEEMEGAADALPCALEAFAESARVALSARAADAALAALVHELAARAEGRMLHHHYDRESGCGVERRCRRVAAWAGGAACGARERCARLTQAGALLAVDRPAHAVHALHPAARLAPDDVRALLARRTDFKLEEIKRLKL